MSGKLFEHDRMIVINGMRSAFSGWTDRLLAGALPIVGLVVSRHALAHLPLPTAGAIVCAVAAIAGGGTEKLIQRRLAFHAYDGLLAADALRPDTRRLYALTCHALVAVAIAAAALLVRPACVAFLLPGYLVGATVSYLIKLLRVQRETGGRWVVGRTIKARMRRPGAGVVCAMLVLAACLACRGLDPAPRSILVGLAAIVAVLALTSLDDSVIRFKTLAGHGAWRIVSVETRGALIFLAITVCALLLASDDLEAGVVGLIAVAGLVLMTARIFAYRIHPKRTADLAVGGCAVAIGLIGFAAPFLLPLAVVAVLWHLYRQSGPKTWLLT